MKIISEKDLKTPLLQKTAVALGSFESLHKGHLKIIKRTVLFAKENGLKSLVSVFRNPVLKEKDFVCETLEERLEILKHLDVDIVVIFDFNDKIRNMDYKSFFKNYIIDKFCAKQIFAGFNYRFGYKALGDTKRLAELCKEHNIGLFVEEPVMEDKLISSTYIHDLIKQGKPDEIIRYLGRPYSITGTVEIGRKIGNEIGFPTANISYPKNKAIIADGVYFGKTYTNGLNYYSIINVGEQPTVTKKHTPKVEVHLINYSGNLYGKEIKTEFLKKLRNQKIFENLEGLKSQLEYDKENALRLAAAELK